MKSQVVEHYGIPDVDTFIWNGLQKQDSGWTWLNGENFSYEDFAPGQPDGNGECGNMFGNEAQSAYQWSDSDCMDLNYFMCESP